MTVVMGVVGVGPLAAMRGVATRVRRALMATFSTFSVTTMGVTMGFEFLGLAACFMTRTTGYIGKMSLSVMEWILTTY